MSDADDWIEIEIDVPTGSEEDIAARLLEPPLTGFECGEGLLKTYVLALNDSEGLRRRIEEIAPGSVRYRCFRSIDYANAWREIFRPFRVGRVCVMAPDEERTLRPNDVPLRLSPGGSFGTGRHATTRTSLLGMQRYLRPGDRVVDAGCGSGILGVAAARLGGADVVGFDIDPNSEASARELASMNGVADRCHFRLGSLATLPDDLVDRDGLVANLYYDLIQRYAAPLRGTVRDGGWFVFGGCHRDEREKTRDLLGRAGWEIEWETRHGKWCAFAGRTR